MALADSLDTQAIAEFQGYQALAGSAVSQVFLASQVSADIQDTAVLVASVGSQVSAVSAG